MNERVVLFLAECKANAKLAFPIVLAQLGLMTLGIVDTAIVGNHSTIEFAGTSLGRAIAMTASAFGAGVAFAVEPLAAQAHAAGEPKRAWQAHRLSLLANLAVWPLGIVLALCAVYTLPHIPGIQVTPETLVAARNFVLGNAPGQLAFGCFLASKSYLQTRESVTRVVGACIVANILNVVVCGSLVRGSAALHIPALGALGAGLASSVANVALACMALGMAAHAYRSTEPQTRAAEGSKELRLGEVFTLGLPMGMQLLAEMGAFSLASLLCAGFGEIHVSAYQVALMLGSFTFMGALGVSGATATRVGHAIGEGRSPRLAGLVGIGLGATIMVTGAVVFASAPGFLARLLNPDPKVIELATTLIRIAAVFQLFDGTQAVAAGALRGTGDVKYPFLMMLLCHWGLGFPMAIYLGFARGMGAIGFWWGLTLGLISVALLLTLRFLRITRGTVNRV
jgi:multidrug resistance protein, MATE family